MALISGNSEPRGGVERFVKLLKLLLSLHSIKLILISVFVITYLGMTATDSSIKTLAVKEATILATSEESKGWEGDNAESIEAKIEIDAITSQRPE